MNKEDKKAEINRKCYEAQIKEKNAYFLKFNQKQV